MKVNTKTVHVEEFGLDVKGGRDMILRIIDNQINNYKIQFLTNWEGNHNLSPTDKNRKIEKLTQMREDVKAFFHESDFKDDEIDFSFNLEIKRAKNNSKALEQQELVSYN